VAASGHYHDPLAVIASDWSLMDVAEALVVVEALEAARANDA